MLVLPRHSSTLTSVTSAWPILQISTLRPSLLGLASKSTILPTKSLTYLTPLGSHLISHLPFTPTLTCTTRTLQQVAHLQIPQGPCTPAFATFNLLHFHDTIITCGKLPLVRGHKLKLRFNSGLIHSIQPPLTPPVLTQPPLAPPLQTLALYAPYTHLPPLPATPLATGLVVVPTHALNLPTSPGTTAPFVSSSPPSPAHLPLHGTPSWMLPPPPTYPQVLLVPVYLPGFYRMSPPMSSASSALTYSLYTVSLLQNIIPFLHS